MINSLMPFHYPRSKNFEKNNRKYNEVYRHLILSKNLEIRLFNLCEILSDFEKIFRFDVIIFVGTFIDNHHR